MLTTFKKYLLIDMSNTRLPLRHGATINMKSPTSEYLDHMCGPAYPLKRGKRYIRIKSHAYSWDILVV
jgi:hypothetical protein